MEHCVKYGAIEPFTTSNYKLTTTPKCEWDVVMGTVECSPDHARHGRTFPCVEEAVASALAVRTGLTRPEVIAVVLYTGPMVRRTYTRTVLGAISHNPSRS